MSALRASADHATVLQGELRRIRQSLMRVWHDQHARDVDQNVLGPLEQETGRIVQAISTADREVDAALKALRHLGAHI